MKRRIRIATRGSLLAVTQTKQVAVQLERLHHDLTCELIILKTTGDRVTDRPLYTFRGTGVFVKELQNALLSGEADLAVHSLKDVPIDTPPQLSFCAFPKREVPNDILITKTGDSLSTLKQSAVVGTSSLRRVVQLRAVRPDLQFADIRGNLDTRIRKLEESQYDALVLAAAGMIRLGKTVPPAVLPLSCCLPAAGQGALALQCRTDDQQISSLASLLNDHTTAQAVISERIFLQEVGGGCTLPIGVYADISGQHMTLHAVIGDAKSNRMIRESESGSVQEGSTLSKGLARAMLQKCKKEGITIQ